MCLDCLDLIYISFKPPASRSRAYCGCNPIRTFETFDISKEPIGKPKHPDSGCFGISGVVIGSALSKGWRSGPEAFRAGHFLRLDRNRKQRMKSLWHPGYSYSKLFFKNTIKVIRFGPKNFLPQTYSQLWLLIHYINNFLRRPGVRYQQDGNRGETPKTGYIQK